MANGAMQPAQGQAPEQQAQGQDPGTQLTELVNNLHSGLGILLDVTKDANPALAEKIQGLMSGFEAVVSEITGGGEQAPEPSQPGEMNQGSPNAVPMRG